MAQHVADAFALRGGRLSSGLLLWTVLRFRLIALSTFLSVVLRIAVLRIAVLTFRPTLPAVVAVALLVLTLLATTVLAVAVVLIAVVAVASVLVTVVAVALVGILSVLCSVVGYRVLLVALSFLIVAVAALPAVVAAVVALLALCALLVLCVAVASFCVFVRRVVAVLAAAAFGRCLAVALRYRVLRALATTLGQWILLDVFVEELLDLVEGIHVVFVDQRDGDTVAVGACRTADAVDIVFGIVRNVVVDHHCDVVDVDTTGQDVRSHQNIDLSALELEHHIVSLGLVEVRVHLTAVDVQTMAFTWLMKCFTFCYCQEKMMTRFKSPAKMSSMIFNFCVS